MRRAWLFALVVSLAGCGSGGGSGGGEVGGFSGQAAPDFQLTSLDGEIVRLSSLKGKAVFLDFWATWCSPCRKSLPETQRLREQYSEDELAVYAVNVGEQPEEIQQYLRGANVRVPVLLDRDQQVSDSFQFDGLPSFFVLDRDHTVRFRMTGWGARGPAYIRSQIAAMGIEPTVQSAPANR